MNFRSPFDVAIGSKALLGLVFMLLVPKVDMPFGPETLFLSSLPLLAGRMMLLDLDEWLESSKSAFANCVPSCLYGACADEPFGHVVRMFIAGFPGTLTAAGFDCDGINPGNDVLGRDCARA